MTTMRDVAARAGVSAKTVSRVFNDDVHVLPETRIRVEAALRELNYVPNSVPTTFRKGRAPVVGVVVPDLLDPFFAAVAESVNQVAIENGMSTVVTSVGDNVQREREIVDRLLGQSLSGLVIAPVSTDNSYLKRWCDRLPIVFVDRGPTGVRADSFLEDDEGGTRLAVEYLIDHGHTRIAFIGDYPDVPTSRNRLLGYRGTLSDRGLPEREGYVVFGALDRDSSADIVAGLAALDEPPTAVVSSNARSSMALVPALRDQRFAVVGFGDFPMADMITPAMTVIDQDPTLLGEHAARRVFDRLAHPKRRFRRRTVLPVRLVERGQCRSPD
ncbi:LacI family DNA-binding transcriptional regulator [Streptomyces sp. enrichment culture]|uniref:LacI family DNA-binding transcriptional regulator n=1 Tax=Streptomyces sp. enrichment culture TaxID=1795815 RepID=UPI003F5730CB